MSRPLKSGSLASRLYTRLAETPVPVRTSILVRESGESRRRVWAKLLELERSRRVTKTTVRCKAEWCACPTCGGKVIREKGKKETFWSVVKE